MSESIQTSFNMAATPYLHFGPGKIAALPSIVKSYGNRLLLITGGNSFTKEDWGELIMGKLNEARITVEVYTIPHEPSPSMIDEAVSKHRAFNPNVVAAIGGGSVLDAGKAISAMIPLNESVIHYLEGIGKHGAHPGVKVPFIAVPTTAGTGSEATKNAVLSEIGEHGYKRSLRHNNFVPDIAIVDAELMRSCPSTVTAYSGMDAFTQLLESYLSTQANPITDALAIEGLRNISRSLLKAFHEPENLHARNDMALAAYLSGITLANAGLGLVHGFASPIGGYFNIPHGLVCSALMTASNRITIDKLRKEKQNESALWKYAEAGKLFVNKENQTRDYYINGIIDAIGMYASMMNIPSLDIPSSAFDKIVSATDNKNNPVALDKGEMKEVLQMSVKP